MNYRLKDNTNVRNGRRGRWLILAGLVAVFLAFRIFAPAFSTHVFLTLFSPFMRSSVEVSDASKLAEGVLKSKQQLILENSELRTELFQLQTQNALNGNLQAENDELRKLLGLTAPKTMIPAIVLSKPPLSPYDSLVIEFGTGQLVLPGNRIYAEGYILLGEVAEVSGTNATVKLYSTAGNEIEATIERNNIAQKAVGAGGGNFEIKAPKELDVVIGDVLVIPGINEKILGTVRQIDNQPSYSFQRVHIKNPVNIFQLKWVTIEAKPQ